MYLHCVWMRPDAAASCVATLCECGRWALAARGRASKRTPSFARMLLAWAFATPFDARGLFWTAWITAALPPSLCEGPAIFYSRGARPNRPMTRSNRSDGLHWMATPLPGRASGAGCTSLLGTQNPASKTPLLRKQDAECSILRGASAGKTNEWLADSEIEDGLSPNAPNATWARRGLFGRGGASRPRPNSTGSLCGRDFWQSRPGGFG